MNDKLKAVIKVSIAALLISYLIFSGKLDFKFLLSNLSLDFFLTISIVLFLALLLNAYRWFLLLKFRGIHISFWKCFKLSFIGLFFNYAMPGGVGGDFVKLYYIVKANNQSLKYSAGVSVLLDRLLGLFSMILFANLSFFFFYNQVQDDSEKIIRLLIPSLSLLFGFLFVILFSFSNRIKSFLKKWVYKFPGASKLQNVSQEFRAFRKEPKVLFLTLGLSFVSQSLLVLFFVLCGFHLGFDLPVSVYFYVVPISIISSVVPITPAGIGVGQVAMDFLIYLYSGEKSNLGTSAMTLQQGIQFLLSLSGAVFYLMMKHDKRVQNA